MPEKIYDGKVLFKVWCEWGMAATNDRMMEFSKTHFGAWSQMGPYYAMWRYAFENPEEAFVFWKDFWFNTYPDREQPAKFENFLLEIKKRAEKNPSIASPKRMERFCAKYNLEMEYRITPNDVIQVTKRDSHLFQKLLIVDGIEGKFVSAHFLYPDGTQTHHELKMGEFGVIGPCIV